MHAYIALKKMEIAEVKGKQHAATELHNLTIFRNKLSATSVPQHLVQMLTSQKDKICTWVEKSCVCVCACDIHKIELFQC